MTDEAHQDHLKNDIAFIPDLSILRYLSPEECLGLRSFGDRRRSICLPLIGTSGVAFDTDYTNRITIQTKTDDGREKIMTFGQVVRYFVDLDCDVYFYVLPAMEFLGVAPCHVVDIRNTGSPRACVNKRASRIILKTLIQEGMSSANETLETPEMRARLKGIVIDITNLWALSGDSDGVYLTCFCEECRSYYSKNGVPLQAFQNRPNPWQLALKANASGVSYIDNLYRDEMVEGIIGKSKLRGFDQLFEEQELRAAAEGLKKFMDVRHNMVEEFLNDVFTTVTKGDSGDGLKRIVITEGVDYDWTSGIFLASLSDRVVDEVWLDPADKAPDLSINHRLFMCNRATYFINAFFDFLSNVGDVRMRTETGLALLGKTEIMRKLEQRSTGAVNRILDVHRALALIYGDTPGFVGFVSAVLDRSSVDKLVSAVRIV